jgi:hypothetical protein
LLNTNTEFLIKSEESSNGALIIQAYSHPPYDIFRNTMYFSRGELVRSAIITISKKIIIKPWVISIRLINFYYFVCAVVGYILA